MIVLSIIIALGCYIDIPGVNAQGGFLHDRINQEENIVLGGLEQYVMTRATNPDNPVLLLLHGGPGSSDIPLFLQSGIGERFYSQLKAPGKELFWFENSAHGALYDEPERFIDIVTSIISIH